MAENIRRDNLLANFVTKLTQVRGSCGEDDRKFLAELVTLVPSVAFENIEPFDLVGLIGYIDADIADDFLSEAWAMHYSTDKSIPLRVLLSSPGGEVDPGAAIASALQGIRDAGRPVHVHVAGSAMSTAFDILQVADHRSAEPTALLMTHHESWSKEGDEDAAQRVNEGRAGIARARLVFEQLGQRTGLPASYYLDKIKGASGAWYITPSEGLKGGLLDEVVNHPPHKPTPAQNGRKPAGKRTKKVEEVKPDESAQPTD
jgi:ATP-dependent protease ClpP protease subunit